MALGSAVDSATQLARSLGQAKDALALAIRLGIVDRGVRIEDLGTERVLLESMDSPAAHEGFV